MYEPMTLVDDGRVRDTSVAAEPRLSAHADPSFHRACWQDGDSPVVRDGS